MVVDVRLSSFALLILLSPARGRGWVRGRRTSIPPHLASPPSGGEEYEKEEYEKEGGLAA